MTRKTVLRLVSVSFLSALSIACDAQMTSPTSKPLAAAVSPRVLANFGQLPLGFEPNLGQTAKAVNWVARAPEYTLFLAGHDAVLELNDVTPATKPGDAPQIRESAVRMHLLGAGPATNSTGQEPLPGKSSYFTGANAADWQRNVPTYAKVRLPQVYPGIDLVYYGRHGQLEYDFVVAPGANASAIQMKFDGAAVKLAANGDLILPVREAGKEIRFDKPVLYQRKNGIRQPVEGSFVVAENQQVSFSLGAYDHTRELVIDPTLLFLGTLGTGNQQSVPNGMAVDSSGEIILTGITNDLTFPTTMGALQTACGPGNAAFVNGGYHRCGPSSASSGFVTKISADGTSLIYSTYLHGGGGQEYGQAVATDASGDAYVLGMTSSNDFPITTDAYQSTCQPVYPTIGFNNPPVFGPIMQTCSGNFAGGGTQYVYQGPTLFIAKLDPSGSNLLYATFLAERTPTYPIAIALDSADNIYFTSFLQNAEPANNVYPTSGTIPFPVTTSAYQSYGVGLQSATLSKLSADGHTLMYSTLFGTLATNTYFGFTEPFALAVGQNGVAFMGGLTLTSELPTTAGTVRPSCVPNAGNNGDCAAYTGWLSAFDTTQSGPASLVYATYIGGSEVPASNAPQNQVNALAADSLNNVYVAGATLNIDYPTTPGAYQTTCGHANGGNACSAAFLSKINPTGTSYLWSTYFGGTTSNPAPAAANGVALDANGRVYLYGFSQDGGGDIPTVNPLQSYYSGNKIFIATFSSDASQLLFGTRLGNTSTVVTSNEGPIANNGIAVDPTGNIYFAGTTNGVPFLTTPGTYATPATAAFNRGFFGKISPILVPTVTGLAINPAVTITGHPVTFTVSVTSPAQNSPAATGTVVLTNTSSSPSTTIGTIQLSSNGTGTFTTSSLGVGTYNVVATYSSDSVYEVSTSAAQTLTINNPTASTVALTVSSHSLVSGSAVTFTATVAGPQGGAVPTGTVFFLDGANTLGSAVLANGTAIYTTSALPTGANSISANYSGDNVFSPASSTTQNVTVTTTAAGLQFIPVTPCRVADTRGGTGPFGGPVLGAGTTRTFNIPQSSCAIPTIAVAYSLNVTVVPNGTLNYLTMWPAGLTQPYVSTLNSDGRIKANAAITPAGTNGGVSVFVSDATNVILDIDGYFVPAGTASALAFYPVTPCRVSDTRSAAGPLGGPFIASNTHRDFPVQSSSCGIPTNAKAYSLNVTAIPHSTLNYLTAWPTGQTQPNVSTLNSSTGAIAANAAIVPASSNGNVAIFVSNDADVILDVNGYFAAPATSGLSLYTTTPCRIVDTRSLNGAFNGVLPVGAQASACTPPAAAQAYVLNATVVPPGPLTYLTLWPNGQTQPYVSTLNALDGAITSNMAIVPNVNGTIDVFSSNPTNVILDISSYFAP